MDIFLTDSNVDFTQIDLTVPGLQVMLLLTNNLIFSTETCESNYSNEIRTFNQKRFSPLSD